MTTVPDDPLCLSNKEDTDVFVPSSLSLMVADSGDLDLDLDLDPDLLVKFFPPVWNNAGIPAFKKEELSVYPPPIKVFVFLSCVNNKSENIDCVFVFVVARYFN